MTHLYPPGDPPRPRQPESQLHIREGGYGAQMLSEQDLLEFDRGRLADWNQADQDRALANHRELFLNHLTIAKHLDFWHEHLDRHDGDDDFMAALCEVAAHLRHGDYLPDGVLYRETIGR